MNFAIYKMAMYEIVKKLHAASSAYHFVMDDSVDYEQYSSKCKSLMEEIFEFTDELTNHFSSIDENTYAMIVCGTIMETFVCEIDYSINMIDNLQSKFADEKTKKYFKHIYYAIDAIRFLYSFNSMREIIEWPNEFGFDYSGFDENIDEFNNELLAAIDECPDYSYAYCLVIVPYVNSMQGVSFNFEGGNSKLKEAFVRSHKCMGDELFRFVMSGNLMNTHLTYLSLDLEGMGGKLLVHDDETTKRFSETENVFFSPEIEAYVNKKGYSVEDIRGAEIVNGFFYLQEKRIPAGIPFYKHFYTEEYHTFLEEMFYYIPQECDGGYSPKWGDNILTDQGDFRIEYKNYALYGGACHMMPLYDSMPRSEKIEELIRTESLNHAISSLLDVSAEEMERLKVLNEELKEANERLKRHIQLNQELVRNLSHSSANYLNSSKLARTGIELHKAENDNPTLDKLHTEGLSLLLQSEQELFLSRQLNSLVWRCSADIDSLTQQIRGGLSKEQGEKIISPIEFAIKIVMARILFREDDHRARYVRKKLKKTEQEITKMQSSFMLDILADRESDGKVLEWWKKNICDISIEVSDVWEKLLIVKDKSFYDLITEIVTEQILNALSHGDVTQPIKIEFGQADEFKGRPRWVFVLCKNIKGERYLGGRGVGVSTLNETILLLNSNKKGIEITDTNDTYESKVWILASLTRVL